MPPYSMCQISEGVDAVARLAEIVVPLENFERPSCDELGIEFSLCNSAHHSVLALIAMLDSLTCGGLVQSSQEPVFNCMRRC